MKVYAIIAKVKYWIEDFVDELTGEVISIQRTEIVQYFIDDFTFYNILPEHQEAEIKSLVTMFNETASKCGDYFREFKAIIPQKVASRLEKSINQQKDINKYLNRINKNK